MADALAPAGRCGIDSVEVARIERLLAETPAEDLAQDLLRRRARRERRGPRARREPRRPLRGEGSVREAVPPRSRAGHDRPCRFFDRARQLWGAASRLRAACRGGARPPSHRVDRGVDDARSRQRLGGGAGRAGRRQRSVLRTTSLPIPAVPPRGRAGESTPRVWRNRPGGGDREARAGALRPSAAAPRRIRPLPFHVGRAQGGAGAH